MTIKKILATWLVAMTLTANVALATYSWWSTVYSNWQIAYNTCETTYEVVQKPITKQEVDNAIAILQRAWYMDMMNLVIDYTCWDWVSWYAEPITTCTTNSVCGDWVVDAGEECDDFNDPYCNMFWSEMCTKDTKQYIIDKKPKIPVEQPTYQYDIIVPTGWGECTWLYTIFWWCSDNELWSYMLQWGWSYWNE
jgi:hypothetical protein